MSGILNKGSVRVALIGQPNVGKSSLFTRLTGVGVISSNYPGTTVEFEEGAVTRNGTTLTVHDLPGTFGLSGNSDDEKVVMKSLYEFGKDSVVLVVVDATNMEGGLVLCFETLELGFPTIVALTKMDVARKKRDIDLEKLEGILDVPVIPISSRTSEGIDELADAVCEGRARISGLRIGYDDIIEKAASALSDAVDTDFNRRGTAIKILEGSSEFTSRVEPSILRSAGLMKRIYSEERGQPIAVAIASARYAEAKTVVDRCVSDRETEQSFSERISDLTISPSTGIPILIGICLLIVGAIVYVGSFLDGVVNGAYDLIIGSALIDFGAGHGEFWGAVFTGIDGSIRATLALVIPYIMVFYIILGILEDSGYLTRAVVLLDRVMHHFGLHGGAFIPMIVGIGCNVPAIMAVRTVKSRREKIILSSMIAMAVPCSAQIAIIMGATGAHSGYIYSLMIFCILVMIGTVTGLLLNRFLKYEPSNLAMALPDLAMPSAKNVLFKTWHRIKDFFLIAFPMLVAGSVIVEVLLQYDLFRFVVDPLSPITVGMLGLPSICVVAFIVGIIRKEMALGMLTILAAGIPLAEFLTPDQFVVFGVVMAIYMPCLATLATMWHEIGRKETVLVSSVSIMVAILMGTAVRILLEII